MSRDPAASHELVGWTPPPAPPRTRRPGRAMDLVPLDPARHGDDLRDVLCGPQADPRQWDYLPYGPFGERVDFDAWLARLHTGTDPLFFAVESHADQRAHGLIALMRMEPEHGCAEIGHVLFGASMQRSPLGTEAVYRLLRDLFESGHRRVEWKCDTRNLRSMRAAQRYGFVPEGVFRRHRVVKGANRDTAWFSIVDAEWPSRAAAFEQWLSPDNFDAGGRQRRPLAAFRKDGGTTFACGVSD